MIVRRLKERGFSDGDISDLFPDKAGTRHFAHEHHTKAPEGTVAGAGGGAVLGGALGWLWAPGLWRCRVLGCAPRYGWRFMKDDRARAVLNLEWIGENPRG